MTQVGTNQSAIYHSQPALSTTGGQAGRSSSTSRQQPQQSQYETEQLTNIRPRLCILRKWPHYDGYGVHLARNQHWLGLRIGDVEPNSPAESGGLLREDVVLAVNGHSVENDDFFVILSFIQHELEADQIRFLVLDPHSADLARRHSLNIDENYRGCVRMETPTLTVSPEKVLYDQWRTTNAADPTTAQNTIHLGPTLSLNQEQIPTNAPHYQQTSGNDGRDDVYTFLPYSDHALENGKTFFDILFEQDLHPSTPTQRGERKPRPTTDNSSNKVPTGDNDYGKDKNRGSNIKDGIKNLAKTGLDNLKSIIPTKSHDDNEKTDKNDSRRKSSTGSVERSVKGDESPSLVHKIKDKIKGSTNPTSASGQEKQAEPYDRLWQTSSPVQSGEDTNNNLGGRPRMCSVILRPGESIGISLQQDKDFSHIIKNVESNSPADLAGVERDDCIITLNDIPLLYVPYQEVLNTLKRYRNEPNLDFLVAKKSYLLKSNQNNNNTSGEVLPSSNINDQNKSSTVAPTQALEQLFNKYNNEQNPSYDEKSNSNRSRDPVSISTSNDRYNQRSPQFDNDRYPSKSQQGQILQGVGPATADRSSWGVSSGKSSDEFQLPASGDSSVRSTSRDRRPDAEDTKGRNSSLEDSFKPLQVGFTNPTPSQQSENVTPNLNDNKQRTSRPTSSNEQRESSPNQNRQNQTLQNIPAAVPITPAQSSPQQRDYDQGGSQISPGNQVDTRLATMPITELKEHGYELYNIQLMQPTETSPVGLKLTKQQDPLQYIITAVAKGTKADLAGLRVDDWLIKIDDKDIRLIEFSEVSHEIRQLLTNAGLINLVIARKKSPASSPAIKQVDKQRTPGVSSRSDSLNRQQGNQNTQSLLTTDITREPPDNNQVRFTPDQSQNTSTIRSQRSPLPGQENNSNAPGGPLSVGITNPISDDNAAKSPRSQSRSPSHSPVREFTVDRQQKTSLTEQPSDMIDPRDIRHITLKEALGLDFNSFIPEGNSQIQTHFISNVQPSSMADKAGLCDGDRILTVNGVDVRNAIHEDVRRMMQSKKPLQLTVVNDPKYLELIEDVKNAQPKTRESSNRSRSTKEVESPKISKNELKKYTNNLFTDDKGAVEVKHCLLKKEPNYNGYGLLLRYQNGLHLIDQVEEDSPAYNAGLREDDVILYVDRKNVEQMTHDDVKILIRKLSLSNVNIDLILIRKTDMQRYKTYQEKNTINWKPILEHKLPNETQQIEQQETSNVRAVSDPVTVPRAGSTTSSSKQPAPAPPSSGSNTRVCILQPSPERTAGFALSGKAPPPYVICQIEKNSPADKAGLLINDILLSINGKSVTETTYEETVKLVKEALQQKTVELVVRAQSTNQSESERAKKDSQSATANSRNTSMESYDSNNLGNNGSLGGGGGGEPSTRGANAVEEYQNRDKSSSSVGGSSSSTTTTKNSKTRR